MRLRRKSRCNREVEVRSRGRELLGRITWRSLSNCNTSKIRKVKVKRKIKIKARIELKIIPKIKIKIKVPMMASKNHHQV